jgi:hypothetical protein
MLGLKRISLHIYRYAWAERAKVAGNVTTFRINSIVAQQQSGASRVCEKGAGENTVVAGI